MAVLFSGKSTDSLASWHYNLLIKKIVSAESFVTPDCLAPTKSSTTHLPDHGVDWTGRSHESSGLGMETGGQSACANNDQQSCCARKPPADGPP